MTDTDLADAPAMDLNLTVVGDYLMRLIALSATLGHAEPRNTLVYAHTPAGSEGEFVNDVLDGMTTAAIAEKWFGGISGLVQLAGAMQKAKDLLAAVG